MAEDQNTEQMADDLVKRDLITREELDHARQVEEETGTPWFRQLIQGGQISFGDMLWYEWHPKSKREENQSLGRTLVDMEAITETQLRTALREQKRTGRLLGNILMDKGLITPRIRAIALSRQYDMDFAELADTPSDRNAIDALPENLALKYEVIPVKLEGDRITVLITDPQVRHGLESLSIIVNKRISAVITSADDFRTEIKNRYAASRGRWPWPRKKESAPVAAPTEKAKTKPEPKAKPKSKSAKTKAAGQSKEPKSKGDKQVTVETNDQSRFDDIKKMAQGAPVIKLVTTIIEGAINSGATDVHLDPQEPEMRVRYRIDGVLHDVMSIAPEIESAVVSRIKIMSDLDITETRRPQDGHISIESSETEFDVRVATLPTYLGERVVLRLLDQSSVLAGILDLGMEKEDSDKLIRLIQQPYGMILVTGPTGSGKTTTLYASLNQKNVMTESIVTIEDPVEYQLSGINQVQVDSDIDVSFASTLRAALRQDIDVLLVGEIRDVTTAKIAIRASMTGHLVFSTLHTNDAPEAISTFRNMGIASYLISSALTGVVAQRLIRTICPDCKKGFTPTKAMLRSLRLPESTKRLYRGAGCESCYQTGNKGRTGIFEVLEITEELRKQVSADEPVLKIAKSAKLKTMADRCRQKVKQGIVSPEEFLRVIRT